MTKLNVFITLMVAAVLYRISSNTLDEKTVEAKIMYGISVFRTDQIR